MSANRLSVHVPMGKLMLATPHVEDALRSCAALLASRAGSIVLCLYGGQAGSHAESASRRARQQQALRLLQAKALQADLPATHRNPAAFAELLRRQMQAHRPDCILLPCGLGHPPQRQIYHAGLLLAGSFPRLQWQLYDDIPMQTIDGALEQRLSYLDSAGIDATPWSLDAMPDLQQRQAALALLGHADAAPCERYWRLQWRKAS